MNMGQVENTENGAEMEIETETNRKRSSLTLYTPRLLDVIRTVTAKLIQESTANQRKLSVPHSVAAKLAAKTFMISNIGRSSFLLNRLGVIIRSVSYKRT